MTETLACAACGRALHVPEELRGQSVKCPACHHTFLAPESGFDSAPAGFAETEAQPVLYPESEVNPLQSPVSETEGILPGGTPPPGSGVYVQPDKVKLIAILTLIGGVIALLFGIGWTCTCIGIVVPPGAYSWVVGIMAIIKAAHLLTATPGSQTSPQTIAIMQIINIVCADVFNLAIGIVTLILLADPEVQAFYRRS
jgi:hypothetical protein